MFGIGLPELIIIIVVALLVVGPSKLPELARSMGRALGEFRRMADDVKDTIEQEMTKPLDTEDEKKAGHEKQAEAATQENRAEAGEATAQDSAQGSTRRRSRRRPRSLVPRRPTWSRKRNGSWRPIRSR